MNNHVQQDATPEFIPVRQQTEKEKLISMDFSPECIPLDEKRIKITESVVPTDTEIREEDIAKPDFILPAPENKPLSILSWSLIISLSCLVLLMILRNSLDWYQSLTHIGIGIGIFYLVCLIMLLSSLGIGIYRMLRDYIHADDGSELAMIGAKLNIYSDLNTVLNYANSITTKYEEHQLEAVRNGVQNLRTRMQVTIDKGDILEEIRKGIFVHIDKEVERLISKSAQQTLWGTAISPVAAVDMAIVAWRTMAMIRDIAALYGYRPGFLGSLRLFSRILSTIAFAGISEITANVGANLFGNALLSRLSVTLAHALGVGLLTVRLGIAASINCRPLPFQKGELAGHISLLFKGVNNILTTNFFKEDILK